MDTKKPIKREFKGVWIPKKIYLDKNLSWTEKILLVEIDSLDQGRGCYASNKYLAKFLQKSESRIANLICKLRKQGMVRNRRFDGRKRYISLTENGKSALPKTGSILENSNKNLLAAKNRQGELKLKKAKKLTFSNKCSQKLEKVIRKKRKICRKIDQKKWTQQFQKFRSTTKIKKSRITKILNWYIEHIGEKYVPKAYSAKGFCEKFMQIEDAYERWLENIEGGGALEIEEVYDDEEYINEDDGPFDYEGLFDDD